MAPKFQVSFYTITHCTDINSITIHYFSQEIIWKKLEERTHFSLRLTQLRDMRGKGIGGASVANGIRELVKRLMANLHVISISETGYQPSYGYLSRLFSISSRIISSRVGFSGAVTVITTAIIVMIIAIPILIRQQLIQERLSSIS